VTPDQAQDGVLTLRLELPASLSACADVSNRLHTDLRELIEQGLTTLLTQLGIPTRPVVTIAANESLGSGTPMSVALGDAHIRYSHELLQRVYSYIQERPLDPLATSSQIAKWLADQCTAQADADPHGALEFLALACLEVLKREPAVLFGPDQARAYAKLLPVPDVPAETPTPLPDPARLREMIGQVLNLGISIADRRSVANALGSAQPDSSPAAIVEDLIERLRPDVVEIHVPRDFLREFTTSGLGDDAGVFPFLREGLFDELGLDLPQFRFVVVDVLRPRTFAFQLNHVASVPVRGLDPEQLLVNDTADRLKVVGIDAIATINPATWQPSSLIDIGREAEAEKLHLTRWNQIQHLVLCLADHLRQNGCVLIHRTLVQERLRTLGWLYPTLVAATRAHWSDDEITGLLRGLLRDGVSIRDGRAILERLVELDAVRKDDAVAGNAWREYALEQPLAFVRIGLGNEIAYKAARQTNTVVVYLLDPAIERMISDTTSALGERADAILRACDAELSHLPPTALRPHILTVMEVRRAFQDLVRLEFPRLSVIAHEELPPGMNVQPIARILMQ
jgi:hypothetical protein